MAINQISQPNLVKIRHNVDFLYLKHYNIKPSD